MKFRRILSLLLCVLTLAGCVFPLVSCDNTDTTCTEHVDADNNGACDKCGTVTNTVCTEHVDSNGDNKCDKCQTQMEAQKPEKTTYTVKVQTVAGMPLEGVTVYIHNSDGYSICTLPKETNKDGIVTFELDTSDSYSIELDGVPNGYNVKAGETKADRYPMSANGQTIMLSSSPIKGESFSNKYEIGDIMHDFTLEDVNGNTYTLSDILEEKRMVMLNFWYVDCSWCFKEFPGINGAYKNYKDDIEVLAINDYGDSLTNIINYPKDYFPEDNLIFPMVKMDKKTTNLIRDKFPGEGYPTTVIIDRYGLICFIEAGAIVGQSKWDKIFAHFTADNYEQKLILNAEDLTPPELPNIAWPGSDSIANKFNGSGDISVEYAPETDSKDAPYSWPFIPAEDLGGISAIRPSNNSDNSYAILYANVQLKPGQAIMFDYFSSTEYGNDNLYVLVDKKDICTLTGVNNGDKTDPSAWEQCCAYVDPRPVTTSNKDELATYSVSFVYMKNGDTKDGEDTVYLKNLRIVDATEIPTETYIFRYAATDPIKGGTGYKTYVEYILHTDGYYHVLTPDGKVGPLLLANFLGYTNFDSKQTMSQRITDEGKFMVGEVDMYNHWMVYANASSNSKIQGYTPITEDLLEILIAYCEKYHLQAGKAYNENLWLQLCIYYDAYGKDKDGNPASPVEDPIKGLTTFSAFETKLDDPQVNDTAKFTVKYDSVIMPRGYLYKFVPTKSGVYRVTSFSDQEVTGWIFTGTSLEWISNNNDRTLITSSEKEERLCPELLIPGEEDGTFVRDIDNVSLVAYMEAGKEYYIDIAYYDLYAVGEFEFEIKYVGEKFNTFVMASPGPITYIENVSGGIGQLIAIGIDYTFCVDEADGKTYAYHVVKRNPETNEVEILGSKIYADFYYPTIPFPSQSITQLIELNAFDFSVSELDVDAISHLGFIRQAGKEYIIEKWKGQGDANAEITWTSKNLDKIVKALQKLEDVSAYPASDVAIAEEALKEGEFALRRDWGLDNIGEEKWNEYNMDEVLRTGVYSSVEEEKNYQKEAIADIDQLWDKTYKMDEVAVGIYHGEGGDKTDLIKTYVALMEDIAEAPERQGCVAVTKELSEILSLLYSKYVFDDVAHDWLKFCFYYEQLGTYVD